MINLWVSILVIFLRVNYTNSETLGTIGEGIWIEPMGISFSSDGKFALVADPGNHMICKIIISTSEVMTLVGSGSAGYVDTVPVTQSSRSGGAAMAFSEGGISDSVIIQPVITDPQTRNGQSEPQFNGPSSVWLSSDGKIALVTDTNNHRIRQINLETGSNIVSTFAGSGQPTSTDGSGTDATFSSPWSLAGSRNNIILIIEKGSQSIRKCHYPDLEVTTIRALNVQPIDVAITSDGVFAFVTSQTAIYKFNLDNDEVEVFSSGFLSLTGVAIFPELYYALLLDSIAMKISIGIFNFVNYLN
jgi:hypothetical protein